MNIDLDQYIFKISVIIKNNPYGDDEFSGGTYRLDFENSLYRIESGCMVIETKVGDEIVGQIFELKTIKSYKLCQ
jgi:hypothetical protein